MKRYSCEFEANEKLMSQVPSSATVSLTFSFYCLLSAYSFDISQSEFLESDILKVKVLTKHYFFNHKVN